MPAVVAWSSPEVEHVDLRLLVEVVRPSRYEDLVRVEDDGAVTPELVQMIRQLGAEGVLPALADL